MTAQTTQTRNGDVSASYKAFSEKLVPIIREALGL